jgi:hypothetical protein
MIALIPVIGSAALIPTPLRPSNMTNQSLSMASQSAFTVAQEAETTTLRQEEEDEMVAFRREAARARRQQLRRDDAMTTLLLSDTVFQTLRRQAAWTTFVLYRPPYYGLLCSAVSYQKFLQEYIHSYNSF